MWQEAKKFDANLDYTERPCLSREKKTEDGRKIGRKKRKEGGKKGERECYISEETFSPISTLHSVNMFGTPCMHSLCND